MKAPRTKATPDAVVTARASGTWPFVVRGGFTLHHKRKVYRGGEIVDLTETEAKSRRHMIEPAPEQEAE